MLKDEEREFLLRVARETVDAWVRENRKPSFEPPPGVLREPRGAFVTLRKDGMLRGCIGLIEPIQPLWEAVRDMAASAATRDPRFPPLQTEEIPGLDIEISVLSPLHLLEDPEDVDVGVHGILIREGAYSGLLLPQVAVEHGWDRETYLDQTCLKAGLPPGSWKKPGVEVRVFTAEVFS